MTLCRRGRGRSRLVVQRAFNRDAWSYVPGAFSHRYAARGDTYTEPSLNIFEFIWFLMEAAVWIVGGGAGDPRGVDHLLLRPTIVTWMSGRRTPRRARRRSAPELPTAGPGERVWVLDVPYGTRVSGTVWNPTVKAHVHVARHLPDHLTPYQSRPYTYHRFIEDRINGGPAGTVQRSAAMRPRAEQVSAARAIARRAAAGGRLFLLADEPGVGKTISAILGARAVAKLRQTTTVLVVADRPAAITIGHWRRSIADVGDGDLTWCVTTWDRLDKVASYRWGIIVADEAHMVRHTTTKRWRRWRKVSGHDRADRTAPFVIAATATPGQSPLELPYLVPHFAQHFNEHTRQWADLPEALAAAGLHVSRGRYGPEWTDDPKTRARDLATVRGWLTDCDPPALLHRSAPWGPVPVEGMPVTLTPTERAQYDSEWGEFCAEMHLARKGRDTARGRAALLRFRQKAGLIRIGATVEWVAAQVEAGRQVAVSAEFVETAADPIRDALEDAGVQVACIYGRDRFDVETERMRFQSGKAPVCVFTVAASISLHAGEQLSDGSTATRTPRVGIFHQARYSGIVGRQITGRTHRDHQVSPWYIAYAEDTVEERVGQVMVERIATASDVAGGETDALQKVASLLGAAWVPSSALTDAE